MPEELPSLAYVREVKGMISARIDHQLDGRSLARAPFHPPFAIFGRRPIVKFADQDNGRNSQWTYSRVKIRSWRSNRDVCPKSRHRQPDVLRPKSANSRHPHLGIENCLGLI